MAGSAKLVNGTGGARQEPFAREYLEGASRVLRVEIDDEIQIGCHSWMSVEHDGDTSYDEKSNPVRCQTRQNGEELAFHRSFVA